MPPPLKASMQSTDYLSNGKRARPSGTHSSEVPLRTLPEYAPKDAPKLDTPFASICSGLNISGASREPLQRINALNRTAWGVAVAPRSLPMTPTRTTPARGPLRAALPCLRHLPFELRSSAHDRGKYSKFRGELAPRNYCSIVRMFGLLDWTVRGGRGRRGSLRTGRFHCTFRERGHRT